MTTSRVTTSVRLLAAAAALLVLGGCAGDDSPTASDPEPTPDPTPSAPQLISYDGDGSHPVEIRTTADADGLAGAPDAFKDFIGRTAERVAEDSSCDDGYVGVRVRTLRTDGYATGSVNDCGGYVALWAVVDGDWKEIDGTQDLWDCAVLTKHRVPTDVAGDVCYDRDVRAQQAYEQA